MHDTIRTSIPEDMIGLARRLWLTTTFKPGLKGPNSLFTFRLLVVEGGNARYVLFSLDCFTSYGAPRGNRHARTFADSAVSNHWTEQQEPYL